MKLKFILQHNIHSHMFLTYGQQIDHVLVVIRVSPSSYQLCEISVLADVYLKNYVSLSSVMLRCRMIIYS
jgi:hypothetical protein